MFCGFTLGSAFGGLAAGQLVADYGWRSVLFLGGVAPLAVVPALWLWLPESVRCLVLKNAPPAQVAAILSRIAPVADLDGATFTGVERAEGSPAVLGVRERPAARPRYPGGMEIHQDGLGSAVRHRPWMERAGAGGDDARRPAGKL
ncbi:hypothetical protein [Benzoatithermus flavus]|uniref:Major Facilitator Superfamily protein n=1 Tax=Benzoatithermus flavus TaxID=3108223 RepID=A0ABU8XVZ0_9PROT